MTNLPKKILRIKDTDIEVKPVLSDKEATRLVCLITCAMIDDTRFHRISRDAEWFVRVATIMTYTNFDLKSVPRPSDIIYDTPLYAMLVGCPERPVYFEGKAYTEPAVDIEQYYTILSDVNNALVEIIEYSKNQKAEQPDSNNE